MKVERALPEIEDTILNVEEWLDSERLKVTAKKGGTIGQALDDAKQLAYELNVEVQLRFNDTTLRIGPHSNIDDVYGEYQRA